MKKVALLDGEYALEAFRASRFVHVVTHEAETEAKDQADYCARNHNTTYRVRDWKGAVVHTAYPNRSKEAR